jgi:hypothetical protein
VGSAKDGDTALLFYAPTAHYTDPLPNPCAPSSPLPTAAHTLQVRGNTATHQVVVALADSWCLWCVV